MMAGTLVLLAGCDVGVVIGQPLDAGSRDGGEESDAGFDGGADSGFDGGPDAGSDDGTDAGTIFWGPLPGETCQTAVRLEAGTSTAFALAGYANDYGQSNGCPSGAGPDGVYVINVPARSSLTTSIFVDGGGNFLLRTFQGLVLAPPANCDASPRVCVGQFGGGGPTQTQQTVWANESDGGQDVLLIVDNWDSNPAPYLVLTPTVAPLGPVVAPPDAGVCGALNCSGCCSGTACAPGNTAAQCGVAGDLCKTCGSNQRCVAGACVANPSPDAGSCHTGNLYCPEGQCLDDGLFDQCITGGQSCWSYRICNGCTGACE